MQTDSIFRTILSALAVLILSNTVSAGNSGGNTKGCGGLSKADNGADVLFYSYEYDSKLSQQEDFFSNRYVAEEFYTNSSYLGLFFVNQQAKLNDGSEMGEVYGHRITFTNFTAMITGYFSPSVSGQHTFEFFLGKTGAASLRVGAGVESCTGFVEKDITSKFAIKVRGDPVELVSERYLTYLDKNLAYPVEIIVNNWVGSIEFLSDVIVPDGTSFILDGERFFHAKKTDSEKTVDAARG